MSNTELLKSKILLSGKSMTWLSERLSCSRQTLYNIVDMPEKCSFPQVEIFKQELSLSDDEVKDIFLPKV